MPTIAIISQKGGAGKTTLALHLAAAAEDSGHTALVIDVDPQATASQWAAWRQDAPPVVIDSAPPRLAAKIEQATGPGAAFIETTPPPHPDSPASAAVEAADLVLFPCRPSAFDLAAIKTTASLVKMRGKPAFVIFTAGSPTAPRMYDEAAQLVQGVDREAELGGVGGAGLELASERVRPAAVVSPARTRQGGATARPQWPPPPQGKNRGGGVTNWGGPRAA
mgnify:CR=1 FL=1